MLSELLGQIDQLGRILQSVGCSGYPVCEGIAEGVARFSLNRRNFACYDPAVHEWEVNPGVFDVLVGSSSRDLPLQVAVEVRARQIGVKTLTHESMIKDFRDHPQGRTFYGELVNAMGFADLMDTEEPSEAGLTSEQISAQRKARAADSFSRTKHRLKNCRLFPPEPSPKPGSTRSSVLSGHIENTFVPPHL